MCYNTIFNNALSSDTLGIELIFTKYVLYTISYLIKEHLKSVFQHSEQIR